MGMFDNAKVLDTSKPAKTKSDKKDVVAIPGMFDLSVVDKVIKTADGLKKTLEARVKEAAKDVFKSLGRERGVKPTSFKGQDGIALGSCELRVRASNRSLNEAERETCDRFGIKFQENIEIPEMFAFNPEVIKDPALMAQIEKALKGVKGLPEHLIIKVEEVKTYTIDDESINQLFKIEDDAEFEEAFLELFDILCVQAVKPNLGTKADGKTMEFSEMVDAVKAMVERESKDQRAEGLRQLASQLAGSLEGNTTKAAVEKTAKKKAKA